jgi:protein-disulfide isomerase
MKAADVAVIGSTLAGGIICGVAAWVSISGATGMLPAWLFGSSTPTWTTYRFIAGVPIELFGAISFGGLLVLTLIGRRIAGTGVHSLVFASAVVLLGLGVGLLSRIPGSVPMVLATVSAGIIVFATAVSDEAPVRAIPRRALWELNSVFSRSASAVALVAYVASGLVLTQQVGFIVRAASREQSSASNLLRWFAAQRGRAVPELAPPPGQLSVVIFSDYQCPTCAALVPEYVRVLSPLRTARSLIGGRRDVTFTVKDFPLDRACNSAVSSTGHPLACESAAAVRLIRRLQGDERATEFERWLYARQNRLTSEDLAEQLDRHGISERYVEERQALLNDVRRDVDFALTIGVSSTPSIFIDGVKTPRLTPSGLENLVTALMEGSSDQK